MSNVIRKSTIEKYLEKGGNVSYLIGREEQLELKHMIVASQTNWVKITSFPEKVFKAFENKMKEDCDVIEMRLINRPNSGPYVAFEQHNDKYTVIIDSKKSAKGVTHYRRCMALVAYFAGIKGGIIKPTYKDDMVYFTEEDWILISIATRYCLMPTKLIKKIFLLTKMYADEGALDKSKPFDEALIENIAFQTKLPDWAIRLRLNEMSFSEPAFIKYFPKKTIDEMIDLYRLYGGYTDKVVD